MALTKRRLTLALLASTTLAGTKPVLGQALPISPSVAHGAVSVSTPAANQMNIQQSTGAAIVNWQGFSIGQGNQVNISQPNAQSSLLNRVTGQTPSTIAGQLNANGQVFLVNPNGIAITKTGVVNAGAFVASTLGTTDEDFKAGRRNFSGTGASAAVVNEGAISVGRGGYAALLGGRVENSGTISVPMGNVGLGSGEAARLDLSGDGFLQVSVPSEGRRQDKALIEHSGTIRATGGRVEMKAASARDAARNVINVSGLVEARSVSGRNGAIVLGGGDGGRVTVSGKLNVSGGQRQVTGQTNSRRGLTRGGDITVTGKDVRLSGATLDASGAGGGGRIRVGGDYQGKGNLQRASSTDVDAATTIKADALKSGNGGQVILWSDQLTNFSGLITARGGPEGGNGGTAEVSGKALLDYTGRTDLSATSGKFGTLLLDPYNVTISDSPDAGTTTAPGTLNVPSIGPRSGTQFTPNANDSNINANTLVNALGSANVIVTTGNGGTQAGNISVRAALSWTAPTDLLLNAAGTIFVNAPISPNAGSLGLQSVLGINIAAPLTFGAGGAAMVTGGNINIGANIAAPRGLFLSAGNSSAAGPLPAVGTIFATGGVNVGAFVLDRGNWVQNTANLPAFAAGTLSVTPAQASFLRAQGGDGSSGNPYLITDVYGLQGMGTNTPTAPLLSRNYALANNIDASGTANWNNGAGFAPIGAAAAGFTGSLDGRGRSIDRVTINRSNTSSVGLFGSLTGAVRDVNLTNASVVGLDTVGAVVGDVSAPGATVSGSSSAGTVSGRSYVGGLVGSNSGTVADSRSSANTSGTVNDIGGLVGQNVGGTITRSTASGAVSGSAFHIGGLVGHNYSGTISNSSASGTAQSTNSTGGAGGLVGENDGTITLSFAIGAESAPTDAGGLVGVNTGQVSRSYATGAATGSGSSSSAVGGLVGTNSGTLVDTFATGAATGNSSVGGLVGDQVGGSVATSYAVGPVRGVSGTGGLIGTATPSAVTDSYWDTQSTGQSASAGGTAQSTAQLQRGLPQGFSQTVWGSGVAGQQSYPYLLDLPIPPSVVSTNPQQPAAPAQSPLVVAIQQPTLSRQLTQVVTPVPRADAVIDVNLGGGGPTLGLGAGGASAAGGNTRQGATQALNFVQRSSAELERRLRQCETQASRGGQSYGACVSGALDQFANTLDTRILQLPAPLRNVAAVIREAARGVRAAPTVAAARAVVRNAVAEVRKAIALIRADEPSVARLQVRQGNAIASALQRVDTRLARAVGL